MMGTLAACVWEKLPQAVVLLSPPHLTHVEGRTTISGILLCLSQFLIIPAWLKGAASH